MNNLLTIKQVAFILKVHPLTIRRYIKDNKLKAIKVGGNLRIEEISLENFKKDFTPSPSSKGTENLPVLKIKKNLVKLFNTDDPLLRLRGRGEKLS